eukprot:3973673-Pyramimonas_sp.AAC.1
MTEFWTKVVRMQTPAQLGLFVLQRRYKKARQVKEGQDEPMEKRGVLTVALNTQDLETARTLWPILMEYLVKVEQRDPIPGAAPRGPTERWLGTQIK